MATRPRAVRLQPRSYDLLQREATRRGTDPDALAEELVRAQLGGAGNGDPGDTLAGLPDLPGHRRLRPAREARRDLEQRDA